MKERIILFIMILSHLNIFAKNTSNELIADTIDYNNYRIIFNAPEYSIDNSLKICEYHGCSYYFPLRENHPTYALTFSFLVMTQWDLASTTDFDIELWNTFGEGFEGSRCFVKNNMYYRIDQYENGVVIFYSNIPLKIAAIANKIIDSVAIRKKNKNDSPIKRYRKEISTIYRDIDRACFSNGISNIASKTGAITATKIE